MGVVWKAYDPVLHRYVALKLMHAQIGRTRDARDRFLREGRAAGALQHHSIITIYDLGEAEGHLYIAMELAEGSDVVDLIAARAPLALDRKLDIAIDLLDGLHYAHQRGVIHRDIKPSNIRVANDGRVKIMDFGIARLMSADATDAAAIVGTPNYMAPEQITNGRISAATDVFAVGCLVYELLTYQRPFEADSMHGVLYRVLTSEPPALRTLAPSIPAALERVVQKAMSKAPEDRYDSAARMRDALAGIRTALSQVSGGDTTQRILPAWPRALLTLLSTAPLQWRLIVLIAFVLVAGSLAYVSFVPLGPAPPAPARVEIGPVASPSVSEPLATAGGTEMPGLNPALGALRDTAVAARNRAVALGADKNAVSAWMLGEAIMGLADSAARATSYTSATTGWREAAVQYRRARTQADTLQRESRAALQRISPVVGALGASPDAIEAAAALGRAESLHAAFDYTLARLAVQQVEAIGLAAGVAPPTPQPVNTRAAVLVLLRDLERAVASEKVGNLRQLSPGMTNADARAWQTLFDRPEHVTAAYRLVELRSIRNAVEADVDAVYTFTPQDGALRREDRRRQVMDLTRTPQGWRLRRVRDRP